MSRDLYIIIIMRALELVMFCPVLENFLQKSMQTDEGMAECSNIGETYDTEVESH